MVVRLSKTGKIVVGTFVALIVCIIGIIVFKNIDFGKKEDTEDVRKLVNQDYTMYVKVNPLIKFTFNEKYFECTDGETGEKSICSDIENKVLKYTLLNDDAKKVWKSADIEGKTVEESLVILLNIAKENKIEFEKISLVSDYEFKEDELLSNLKKQLDYDLKLEFDYQNVIKEDDVIKILEGQAKKYTVTFDSNGGSEVTKQMVIENGTVSKPKNPERKNYSFVYWTLNGKEFNFNTKIVENITLEAKWEKAKSQDNPKTQTTTNDSLLVPVLKNVTLDTMEHEGFPRLVELVNGVYQYDLGIDKSAYSDKNNSSKYSVTGYVIEEKLDGPMNRIIIDTQMTADDTAAVTVEPGEVREFIAKVYVTDKNGKKTYSSFSNVIKIDHTKLNVPTLKNETIQQMESNGGIKPIELNGCKYYYDLAMDKSPYRINKNSPFKYIVSGYTISEKNGTGIKSPFMSEDDVVMVGVEPGEKKEFVANVFANAKSGHISTSEFSNVITIDHTKPSAPTLKNITGQEGFVVDGLTMFDLGIDKSAYRVNQNDNSKFSVTGYALYEKVGSTYNIIRDDILMSGAESIAVSVPDDKTKEFVARVYAVNCTGTKIYSNYSNVITLSN